MKRSKRNKEQNQLHDLDLQGKNDSPNHISLSSQLTGSMDEVPYLECSTTYFTTYDLKSGDDKKWNQIMINPHKLPGFTYETSKMRADLHPIIESLDLYVMPKFTLSKREYDRGIIQMTGNQLMFMAGVPARASGMGKRMDGTDAYDDGFFQPHRRLIEPSTNLTYRHSAHFNYLQLQKNQQQLIQVNCEARPRQALILCSVAVVNPIDGGNILGTDVIVNLMIKLRYSVPIWMMDTMQTQRKETNDPTDESDVPYSLWEHMCYPDVRRVKHVN